MKKYLGTLIILASLALPFSPARADDALVVTALNMRSGPHSSLPVVTTLRRNERVELLGCVQNYEWCEVRTSADDYGWVSSYYLRGLRGNNSYALIDDYGRPYSQTTIIIYRPRQYWDDHYRNRDFYRDRDRWFRDSDSRGGGRGRGRDDDDDHHDDHHGGWDDSGHHGGWDNSGHHGNHSGRPTRPSRPAEPAKELKYKPMEMPSRKAYNPLCPMGQKTC